MALQPGARVKGCEMLGRMEQRATQMWGANPPSWKVISSLWTEENISGASCKEMPCVHPLTQGSSLSYLACDQGQTTKGSRRRRKTTLSLWRLSEAERKCTAATSGLVPSCCKSQLQMGYLAVTRAHTNSGCEGGDLELHCFILHVICQKKTHFQTIQCV